MIENPNSTTIKNNDVDATNNNSTSLVFNQFDNFSPEQKHGPENTVNSNYYGTDQFQTLKFHEKINACSLSSVERCISPTFFFHLSFLISPFSLETYNPLLTPPINGKYQIL